MQVRLLRKPPTIETLVRPVLSKHCFACHNEQTSSGGMNIQSFLAPASLSTARSDAADSALLEAVAGASSESTVCATATCNGSCSIPKPRRSRKPNEDPALSAVNSGCCAPTASFKRYQKLTGTKLRMLEGKPSRLFSRHDKPPLPNSPRRRENRREPQRF